MISKRISWESIDMGLYFEITPVGDLKEHYAGDECWCEPRIEYVPDGTPDRMIIHNAADNRE